MTWLSQALPLLALLAALPLLYALSLVLTALSYMRLRLRTAPVTLVDRQALTPESRTVLDAMRPQLQALGFSWCASLKGRHPQVMEPDLPLELDLYVHAGGRAWALAQPEQAESAAHGRTVGSVTWLSFFADGCCWVGFNGRLALTPAAPPGWTYVDDAQPGTAQAWAAYERRLSEDPAPVVHGLDEVVQRLGSLAQSQAETLQAQGRALPAGQDCWRLTWRQSLRMAWGALQHARRENKATPAAVSDALADAHVSDAGARQQSEALRFAYQKALMRALGSAHNRHRSFWVTAVLFLAVGAVLFSWDMAWMLLLVVAVHEGGHWLAMRWAGYQRQSVFFIPGLGGMATGEKPDATPLEKVGVFLAGPMPGLVLAVGVMAAVGWGLAPLPPAWAMQLLLLTLLINAFNLLPITPLDGGRVVEALLFARLPVLRLVFALAGMAALGGLAWFSRDPLLSVIAGVLLLGLPWQWRVMRLERAIHLAARTSPAAGSSGGQAPAASRDPASEAEAVRRLFGVLQQPVFARWPFMRRAAAVGALLPSQQARAPRWGEAAAGLLIYLACLALPVAALVGIYKTAPQGRQAMAALWNVELEPSRGYSPETHMADIEDRLVQALQRPATDPTQQEQQVQARLDAAEEMLSIEDYPAASERARELYQSAWALARPRGLHDLVRAQALKGMADTAYEPEQAAQWHQQLVAELQGAQGPVRLVLASAQAHLAQFPMPGVSMAQRLGLMAQAVESHRAEADTLDDAMLLHARVKLARLLDVSGHPEAAQAQLYANVVALQAAQNVRRIAMGLPEYQDFQRGMLMQAEALYARFLASHGQAEEGVKLARNSLQRAGWLQADHYASRDSQSAWLWAAMATGQPLAVRQALAGQHPAGHAQGKIEAARDTLAVAQWLDDPQLHSQALTVLQQLPAARRAGLCRSLSPRADIHIDWRDMERQRRYESVQAAGLCSG
jgi:Zn-dependent protease